MTTTNLTTTEKITLATWIIMAAEKHAPQASMRSSAELSASDARATLYRALNASTDAERLELARCAARRALDSLEYSIGRLNPITKSWANTVANDL